MVVTYLFIFLTNLEREEQVYPCLCNETLLTFTTTENEDYIQAMMKIMIRMHDIQLLHCYVRDVNYGQVWNCPLHCIQIVPDTIQRYVSC